MSRFEEKTMPAVFQNRVEQLGDACCTSRKVDGRYKEVSWKEMNNMVRATARYLHEKGIGPGDKVAIFAENRYEWWVVDLAVLSLGAIDVPIYSTNSPGEAEYILRDSGSSTCFVGSSDHLARVQEVRKALPDLKNVVVFDDVPSDDAERFSDICSRDMPPDWQRTFENGIRKIDPESLATFIYTSGTTGDPKGVMLTHKNFVSNVRQGLAAFQGLITPEDIFLSFLPLSHSLERTVGYYLPLYTGSQVYFAESFQTILDDFLLVRPTIIISVPRLYEKMHAGILSKVADASSVRKMLFNWAVRTARKNLPYVCNDLPRRGLFKKRFEMADALVFSKLRAALGMDRLRIAISGGGPLAISDAEFFLGMEIMIYEGFGLTETTPVTNVNVPGKIKPGTVGPPLVDTNVRISDEGEIQIRGPQVMRGYFNRPEDTREVFTSDGYFKTGDIGVVDEEGYLSITGRIKDIIVTAGGKNISPQNIENSIKASPLVEQVAVIGDRRKYLSALVVPALDELKKWAERQGVEYGTDEELLAQEPVRELYRKEIDENTRSFARVEKIRQFKLLKVEWSQETGELTPKQSVKRRVIEEKYAREIGSMYQDE